MVDPLRHSVYDCLYVALVVQEDCMLVTADTGLVTAMAASTVSYTHLTLPTIYSV